MKRLLKNGALLVGGLALVVCFYCLLQVLPILPAAMAQNSITGQLISLSAGVPSTGNTPLVFDYGSLTFYYCNAGTCTSAGGGGSSYNPAAVAITGGTIDGTVIGGTTPAAGTFASLMSTLAVAGGGNNNFTSACTQASNNCYSTVSIAAGSRTWEIGVGGTSAGGFPGALFFQNETGPVTAGMFDTNGNLGIGPSATNAGADPFFVTTAGFMTATTIMSKGTTNVSGCSLSSAVGGQSAGQFHSGTTGTCTVTITPGVTAGNGWSCRANDLTTPADTLPQTTSSTTACVVAGTTVTGDVINWTAIGF